MGLEGRRPRKSPGFVLKTQRAMGHVKQEVPVAENELQKAHFGKQMDRERLEVGRLVRRRRHPPHLGDKAQTKG